jgi:predicted ribosome quality control (RQC) complex YloA/Tae2 family protein
MSNLEYSFLANELSEKLSGKHFSRMRKVADGLYRIKIGSYEIICQPGVRLHITKYLEPAQKDGFLEKVEKELDNAKLLSVEQVNQDRIIAFNFDRAALVFEMFGKGNIILAKDGKTVAAMKTESWSNREIHAGREYKYPVARPSDDIQFSDRYIIVSLTKLPLGKEYALEALQRAGIDEKTPGTNLSKEQRSEIEKQIQSIRSECRPYIFIEEGRPADFALALLSRYSSLESREVSSLSEAADEYYNSMEAPNQELEKLKRRLDKQNESMKKLVAEEKELREKGDYIYEHYQQVEQVLADAKEGKGKLNKKERSVEADL